MANLLAEKDIARSFVEALPAGVGLWYVSPFSCYLNEGVRELTGFAAEDFQRSRLFWLRRVHPGDRKNLSELWRELQSRSTKVACEYRFLPKGKHEQIWIKEVSHSFESADGNVGGIVSVYREVSAEREEGNGAGKTDDDLPRIIRGLVHDLCNHVHTINGAVELALMTGPRTFRSDDITHAAESINKLVEDLKDYFIPPAPQLAPTRIDSMLEEVGLRTEHQFRRQGVTLEVMHQGELPFLWLDVKQVARAMASLVEFFASLLQEGGELSIETQRGAAEREDRVEIRMHARSLSPLEIDAKEVFRPYPELQQFKAGLEIALARDILRRNRARIYFQQFDPQSIGLVVSFDVRRLEMS